jgi:hypothetical protein
MLKLIKLKVIQINYDQALKTLGDIINGKTAYDQVLTNHLQERLTDNTRDNILNLTADKKFKVNVSHTAILMDDAIKIHLKERSMLFLRICCLEIDNQNLLLLFVRKILIVFQLK